MRRVLFFISLFCLAATAYAQPRPVDKTPASTTFKPSYDAQYEGGLYGASDTDKGTLRFDDANERIVFFRKDGREMFAIPYAALIVVYPDSKVVTSTTGNVMSRLPLPGAALAGLLSTKKKFLIMQFDDPDIEVKGTANFRFEKREMLLEFITGLGTKAKMKQRGDAYYRARGTAVY